MAQFLILFIFMMMCAGALTLAIAFLVSKRAQKRRLRGSSHRRRPRETT